MGRSVSELRNSTMQVYVDVTDIEDELWDFFEENVIDSLINKFPYFDNVSEWDGENKIILKNKVSEIAISEYCGLACISGRPTHPFGERFLNNVERYLNERFETLRRIGTFSNGVSVYERR